MKHMHNKHIITRFSQAWPDGRTNLRSGITRSYNIAHMKHICMNKQCKFSYSHISYCLAVNKIMKFWATLGCATLLSFGRLFQSCRRALVHWVQIEPGLLYLSHLLHGSSATPIRKPWWIGHRFWSLPPEPLIPYPPDAYVGDIAFLRFADLWSSGTMLQTSQAPCGLRVCVQPYRCCWELHDLAVGSPLAS